MHRLASQRLVRIPGLSMPLVDIVNVYRRNGTRPNAIAEQFIALLRSKIESVS